MNLPKAARRRILRFSIAGLIVTQVLLLGATLWFLLLRDWSVSAIALIVLLLWLLMQAVLAATTFVIKWAYRDWPLERRGPLRRWLAVALTEIGWTLRLFLFDQPLRTAPSYLPAGDQRPPLLLVHGFVCNGAVWRPLAAFLRALGRSHVALSLQPTYRHFESQLQILDEAVQSLCVQTEQARVVLVGHSMGGLLARAYAERYPDRCAGLLSVGAPHHGTALGDLIHGVEYGPPSPRCQWLQRMNTRTGERIAVPALNLWSADDNIVIPAGSAKLANTPERTLHGFGHMALIASPRACTLILQALGELELQMEQSP